MLVRLSPEFPCHRFLMNKSSKIVCFGEALIDMLAQPSPIPDVPHTFLPFAGGAPANVAVAVARLGGNGAFVGALGEDMFGDFLLQSLVDAGVASDGVVRTDEARTGLAFVALDARGERSFSFYRPPAADMLFRSVDFDRVDFTDARAFHVCSNSMSGDDIAEVTFAGMRRARLGGAMVSFDVNLRPMLWPKGVDPAPRIWQALALADVVKFSREEFDWLCGASGLDAAGLIERLWQGPARLLLITDGGQQPLHWLTRTDSGEIPTFESQVSDSTAAGDAFVAGMLYQFASGNGAGLALDAICVERPLLENSLRFAAAVGALAVTRRGAFTAMPPLTEVQALIAAQPWQPNIPSSKIPRSIA